MHSGNDGADGVTHCVARNAVLTSKKCSALPGLQHNKAEEELKLTAQRAICNMAVR